jgi:hypothetical protein
MDSAANCGRNPLGRWLRPCHRGANTIRPVFFLPVKGNRASQTRPLLADPQSDVRFLGPHVLRSDSRSACALGSCDSCRDCNLPNAAGAAGSKALTRKVRAGLPRLPQPNLVLIRAKQFITGPSAFQQRGYCQMEAVRRAKTTRGIPARSLVSATSAHSGVSSRRRTCSAEL